MTTIITKKKWKKTIHFPVSATGLFIFILFFFHRHSFHIIQPAIHRVTNRFALLLLAWIHGIEWVKHTHTQSERDKTSSSV